MNPMALALDHYNKLFTATCEMQDGKITMAVFIEKAQQLCDQYIDRLKENMDG